MTPILTALALLLAQHGEHDAGPGKHGNPGDLASYIAAMEEPERDAWQKPDLVVSKLGLKSDSVVCDVGAGPGYFSLRLAKVARHVFAVDVEPRMVEALRDRLAKLAIRNVTPVLALPDDALLPAASCDVILIVDTFHHFPDGVAYLTRLAGALRPRGKLINIDFHKRELPVGPRLEHKVSREDFLAAAKQAGYALKTEHRELPYQYFLVLGR